MALRLCLDNNGVRFPAHDVLRDAFPVDCCGSFLCSVLLRRVSDGDSMGNRDLEVLSSLARDIAKPVFPTTDNATAGAKNHWQNIALNISKNMTSQIRKGINLGYKIKLYK